MCVSLSLYYDVKFGGSHYVMHFLVFISYRYINYMCAFKLPVDQEYAIRQSFAGFLLLTPLFFSEFLGSNDKGNGGEWWPRFKTGPCRPPNGRQGPVAPGVGDRGLSPVGGATGPPFFSTGTSLQIWRKKIHFGPVTLWEGDWGI